MNLIQIIEKSGGPKTIHNIVSCDIRGRSLINVNFHPPLADVSFLFKDREERDLEFNDIREKVGGLIYANDNV